MNLNKKCESKFKNLAKIQSILENASCFYRDGKEPEARVFNLPYKKEIFPYIFFENTY